MEVKNSVYSFFLLTALIIFPSQQVTAFEVGDTVSCVKLVEIFNPHGPSRENGTDCLEVAENEQQEFTMLEFFTVECGYCTQNLPLFAQLSKDIAQTTTSRLVSLNRSRSPVEGYIEAHREFMVVPVLLDVGREAGRVYDVKFVPSLYVINKDKKVLFKKIGVLSEQDILAIRQLVGQVRSIE